MKFSSRHLFVFITVSALLFMLARRELETHKFVHALRAKGVSVYCDNSVFDYVFPSYSSYSVNLHDVGISEVADELIKLKGIESLSLRRSDSTLSRVLAGLPNLHELRVKNCNSSLLSKIANAENLTVVSLSGGLKNGRDFCHLATLKQLRELDLSGTAVTDSDMACIALIPRLTKLNLSFTDVTGQGLQYFSTSGLKSLILNETRICDECIQSISCLGELEELELVSSGLSYYAVLRLADSPVSETLRRIVVYRDYHNANGVSELAALMPCCNVVSMMPALPLTVLNVGDTQAEKAESEYNGSSPF